MAATKKWEDLSISNDFIFGKVMGKPDLCKELLELILDIEIDHVEYPELQKSIELQVDARGIRLDVYVKDANNTVYNIEMQTTNSDNLAKRSRYYQGLIDLSLTERGMEFEDLPKSYIIFICVFDPFKKGYHKYTFSNHCEEDQSIVLRDEAVKIFLNATSKKDDVSSELRAFLDYVGGEKGSNAFVQKLDQEISAIKANEVWRREYMTLAMRDRENFKAGREAGREEGRAEILEHCVRQLLETMPKEQVANILGITIDAVSEIEERIKNKG